MNGHLWAPGFGVVAENLDPRESVRNDSIDH